MLPKAPLKLQCCFHCVASRDELRDEAVARVLVYLCTWVAGDNLSEEAVVSVDQIRCATRLGGLLKSYSRAA